MKFLKNKKIIISPCSPLSISFASYLKNSGFNVIGFFDKNKIDDNIFKLNDSQNIDFDIVLIYNELFFNSIYKETKKVIRTKNIYRVVNNNGHYKYLNSFQIRLYNLSFFRENISSYILNNLQKVLSALYDRFHIKRTSTIFIAKDSIGSNLKFLYLYYIENYTSKVAIITNNTNELHELKRNNLPSTKFNSIKSFFLVATAKNLIVDQVIFEYFKHISLKQQTIQLWHGVGLKKLHTSETITYDKFISTSHWTNETNFKHVFEAKEFLNLGYPRNDIFFRDIKPKDLLFCNKKIYNFIKKNFTNKIKTIMYMPTYRDSKEENIPPLNLELLNNEMVKQNSYFIIKLHPLVVEQLIISNGTLDRYSNIVFYNSQGDIYPILKYIDILVTDYSSVAYDFLLLDRPIIFFNYDYERYIKNRGDFLFNYDDFTPGIKVKTEFELLLQISHLIKDNDTNKKFKEEIKNLFFDNDVHNSNQRIFNKVINETI